MKYLLLSLISAMLFCISWPTYGIPYFIFFAFVPLLMAEHEISKFSDYKKKGWKIFGLTYLTFFIWNLVTTGWLYYAKNPDGSHAILAVAIPLFANSLLMSLTFLLYHWFKKVRGTYFGLVFFVAVWMSFEKMHLEWELSWPWLNLGNVFADHHQVIQWYDTFGATGGSFWILFINVWAFYTLRIWEAGRKRKDLIKNATILCSLILVPILISLWKYNTYQPEIKGNVNVVLLQPELDPYNEKYAKDSLQILSELLDVAKQGAKGKVDIFLGPETAFPGNGSLSETGFESSQSIAIARKFLLNYPNSVFITGASTHRFFFTDENLPKTANKSKHGEYWVDHYNAALQIIPNQKVETYHKAKLVPGAEIFPYKSFLEPILGNAMLNFGGSMISLGTDEERKVFQNKFNDAKIAPIICYESIYGEFVTDYIKNGSNLLAISTNDSWWDFTQGHKQLLVYAKLRAIETRREIVRAANSGTSALINSRGDVVETLPYGSRGAITVKANLMEGKTNYIIIGDLISRICIFILGFSLVYHFAEKLARKK